ncbi:MAG: NAD(P)/FAD-dependent oxidoreductase, partial [Xanthobacteraceae bacterium]
RPTLPVVNPNRWIEFAGFLRHFGDLDDAKKWRFMKLIFDMKQPPPQESFQRCVRHRNFTLQLGSPIERVKLENSAVQLTAQGATTTADFVIAGTGFGIDFSARPELGRLAPYIARWSDRYQPPPGEEHPTLGGFPYLSSTFQFTEKETGSAPYLKNVFCYTYAAMPSLACSAGISQLKFGIERIGFGITRELFLADADRHLANLCDYSDVELDTSAYETAGHTLPQLKSG